MANISEFQHLTFNKITGMEHGSEEVVFETASGTKYIMNHQQDCCESVWLEDVAGDVNDLIDTAILRAEERVSCYTRGDTPDPGDPDPPAYMDSLTWTFYELATIKGSVTLRWQGESNGYYSESVDINRVRTGADLRVRGVAPEVREW